MTPEAFLASCPTWEKDGATIGAFRSFRAGVLLAEGRLAAEDEPFILAIASGDCELGKFNTTILADWALRVMIAVRQGAIGL